MYTLGQARSDAKYSLSVTVDASVSAHVLAVPSSERHCSGPSASVVQVQSFKASHLDILASAKEEGERAEKLRVWAADLKVCLFPDNQ